MTLRCTDHGKGGAPDCMGCPTRHRRGPGRQVLIEMAYAGSTAPGDAATFEPYPPPPGASRPSGAGRSPAPSAPRRDRVEGGRHRLRADAGGGCAGIAWRRTPTARAARHG